MQISCPACKKELPLMPVNTGTFNGCPHCGNPAKVETFPAFYREPEKIATGERLSLETDSSCFYHSQNKAAALCAACGRFICALCEIDLESQKYCPNCLDSGKRKGKIVSLENKRVLNDSIALQLSLISIPFWFVSFITGPAAVYWAIRHSKTPRSLVRRSNFRNVVAIILGTLITLSWVFVIGALIISKL